MSRFDSVIGNVMLSDLNSFDSLQSVLDDFSDLPAEAIIKQDVLREGLSFSEDSLRIATGYKPKDYFIFSFDLIPIAEMEQNENLRAPEEIKISGGTRQLRDTVISVRVNPRSPYRVDLKEGKLQLLCLDSPIAEVCYHPVPNFYNRPLQSGKSMGEIAPVIEWGYLIYLTVYRLCQYFNKEEQCQFCDLNKNYKQQRQAGRAYTGVKSVEEIIEALSWISEDDKQGISEAITITGGAILKPLRGEDEVTFYSKYAHAIREKFGNRWILKAVVQAFEQSDVKRLHDSGFNIYHPNFEVWDEKLFPRVCPGKERFIGRDGWINRVVESADIFGPANVIPNFVGGVEMNRNYGFSEVEPAIASTAEGLDFFMSKGIMPRFTTWCPEPYAKLGPQPAPPLEYFCRLLQEFKACFYRHKLPKPKGYGPTGVGNAVFSVSAFMDVL